MKGLGGLIEVKMRPRRPKMAPTRPKIAPTRAKTAPRRASKRQNGPRWRQDGPRWCQGGQRRRQDGPRRPQFGQHGRTRAASERAQRASERSAVDVVRFSRINWNFRIHGDSLDVRSRTTRDPRFQNQKYCSKHVPQGFIRNALPVPLLTPGL